MCVLAPVTMVGCLCLGAREMCLVCGCGRSGFGGGATDLGLVEVRRSWEEHN